MTVLSFGRLGRNPRSIKSLFGRNIKHYCCFDSLDVNYFQTLIKQDFADFSRIGFTARTTQCHRANRDVLRDSSRNLCSVESSWTGIPTASTLHSSSVTELPQMAHVKIGCGMEGRNHYGA
jgi:hypothetical protein